MPIARIKKKLTKGQFHALLHLRCLERGAFSDIDNLSSLMIDEKLAIKNLSSLRALGLVAKKGHKVTARGHAAIARGYYYLNESADSTSALDRWIGKLN